MTPDVVDQRRAVRGALDPRPGERMLDIGSGPGLARSRARRDRRLRRARGRRRPRARACSRSRAVGRLLPATRRSPSTTPARPSCRLPTAASTPPSRPRSTSTSRTCRARSPRLAASCDPAAGCWCSTPTGTRSSGTRRTGPAHAARLAAWDEHLADPYLPRRLGRCSPTPASRRRAATAIPLLNVGYDPRTYSAGLIRFISAFVPGRQGLTEEDAVAWADDLLALGEGLLLQPQPLPVRGGQRPSLNGGCRAAGSSASARSLAPMVVSPSAAIRFPDARLARAGAWRAPVIALGLMAS